MALPGPGQSYDQFQRDDQSCRRVDPGQASSQSDYDQIYLQCMYGHGHRIPLQGPVVDSPARGPEDPIRSDSLPLPPRTEEVPLALPPR